MKCKFCNEEIDESLKPPNQARKVLRWHWQCFQFIAMNHITRVIAPNGEDITDFVLVAEFEQDEGEISEITEEKLHKLRSDIKGEVDK